MIEGERRVHVPVVTTSRDATGEEWVEEARELARRVRGVYVPRDDRPLSFFFTQGYPVVVLGGQGMRVHTERGELFYHPGMGRTRIRRLRKGGTDVMVTAMGLERGQRVLDCTLGLGSDAGVASFVVGEEGTVVGWESVPVLAELVRRGMQTYCDRDPEVTAALRRIQVVCADHRILLPATPDRSFDVVYFDPMFREPVYETSHFVPLRALTDHRPLDPASIRHAVRVARRRVVIKERKGSPVFQELGVDRVVAAGNSRIAYGVIDVSRD